MELRDGRWPTEKHCTWRQRTTLGAFSLPVEEDADVAVVGDAKVADPDSGGDHAVEAYVHATHT